MLFRDGAAVVGNFAHDIFYDIARDLPDFEAAEFPKEVAALLLIRFRGAGCTFALNVVAHPLLEKFVQRSGRSIDWGSLMIGDGLPQGILGVSFPGKAALQFLDTPAPLVPPRKEGVAPGLLSGLRRMTNGSSHFVGFLLVGFLSDFATVCISVSPECLGICRRDQQGTARTPPKTTWRAGFRP
jgi:hypothetical protein